MSILPKKKRVWKQAVSWLLCLAMIAPNVAPIVSQAAVTLGNMPRRVDFARQKALTLKEIGLRSATGSNASDNWGVINMDDLILDEDNWMEELEEMGYGYMLPYASASDLATDAEWRLPEDYYDVDAMLDEPDGDLIQFNDYYRTYEIDEHEYITVMGGYSGMYQDENGEICQVDNSLRMAGNRSRSAANMKYYNTAGRWDIVIPAQLTSSDGITMEHGSTQIELIPEGDFTRSLAAGNAVRFADVYENIDYQYTVLGDTLKEDIILLEPTDKNTFTYRLKTPGLKAEKQGKSIIVYKNHKSEPLFQLEAPVMLDNNGEASTDMKLGLTGSGGNYTVRLKVDEDWLNAADRSYPVRIDPASMVPSDEFLLSMTSDKKPNEKFGWDADPYVGYRDEYGNCRLYIAFNEINCASFLSFFDGSKAVADEAVLRMTTQTGNGVGKTVFQLAYPTAAWDAHTVTWNHAPALDEHLEGAPAAGANQFIEFDITKRLNEWIQGTQIQAGFAVKAMIEPKDGIRPGDAMPAELFYNRNSETMGPRIEVHWTGEAIETDMASYPLADTTTEVKPAILATEIKGRTATGVIAHGKTTAEAEVKYTLLDESDAEIDSSTDIALGSLDRPDFEKAMLENDQKFLKQSNWQSEGYAVDGLELDTIYHFSVSATAPPEEEEGEGGEGEGGDKEPETFGPKNTDEFLLYEVQLNDIVQRIAQHYDVNPNIISRDNYLYLGQLTEEGTILFIRNPKTADPYTPAPMTTLEQDLLNGLLLGTNPECLIELEPVNINTGNFYMNQTDAEIAELNGVFGVSRSYNSLIPDRRSEFGMGWSSPLGERLTVLGDGRVLYKREDGALITLKKDGDVYKGENGRDLVLETMDSLDVDMATRSNAEEDDGEDEAYRAVAATTGDQSANQTTDGQNEEETDAAGGDGSEDGDGDEDGETVVPALPGVAGWKLISLDGSERVFDSLGFLRYREDRKGNRTTLIYDDDYNLLQVISPTEKILEITMDEEYRITDIGLPDGTNLAYEYDEDGNLVTFTDQKGDTRNYQYDGGHHMTAWQDENGNTVVDNIYDDDGRVVQQTDANGGTATIRYEDGRSIMTDNRGNDTTVYLDEMGRSIRVVYANGTETGSAYDDAGHLVSKTDANGATTRYTYDESGNILTETRADGTGASYTYNDSNLPLTVRDYEGNTTSFTYDEKGNLLSMRDGAGNTTRYGYDDLSRVISITDANGGTSAFAYDGAVIVSYTDPEGGVSTFTYDEMNRILTQTDPEGSTTEHDYNANGWELAVTAPDGGMTAYEFSPAGEVLSITDAMGVATTFTYDAMHNILSGEDALGNTLHYDYDANYNKVSETNAKGDKTSYDYDVRDRMVGVTDALGNGITYALDGNGNTKGTTDRRGSTTETWHHKVLNLPTMTKDALGNETYYQYDGNGSLTKVTYPDGSSIRYAYDRAGRLVSTTAKNGLVTEISYDGNGNIVRITDDDTRIYRFVYDGNNRLVKATDPLGGVTEYTYDGAGRQTEVTDANGNSTAYTYDAVGRLNEMQDALGGTVSTEYDLVGRTLSATDQNGSTTAWHYDVIGQVLAQVDAAENITAMEYDPLGNVTKVTDALKGETAMDVDALSRTVKMTDALGGQYTYEYDENGNLLQVTMPDGDTVSMTYDANDRMTYYRDEASVVTRYEYDSMGRITKASDTAGNTMTYAYDQSGNLVRQTDTIGRDATYEYDAFNRLVAVTGTDLATTTYTYDALDRLASVTQADGTVTTYEYDPVGNLIKTTEPGEAVYTYAYDAINRLTGKVNPLGASTEFQYDAKGNLTSSTDGEGSTTAYVYDVIDRLTTFTDGRGNDTAYEYDELSRLLSYTTPEGSQTEYRYDALSRMTKAKDANGLITEYQYDVMGNLTDAISPKGAKTSYTYDKHDELTGETDPAGNITAYAVDLNRQVTGLTQKNGAKYAYTYDAVHRLTGITTPLGLERTFTYDVADNIIKDTDNLDRTTTYEYDIMHRMTKSTNAKGGVTEYGYDIRGNQSAMTDAMGYTWKNQYDLVDQLTKSVDPEGKATEAAYDLVGNITSITRPGERTTAFHYDQNYNTTALTDPKGYVYSRSYDKDNRVVSTLDPLQQTEGITYDPGSRVTAMKDKMGLTRGFTYDAHGNVLTSKATNGLITQFQYDILDNLVNVTDPMGYQTSYQYDVMGNVTSMTNAKLKTTQYGYDLEGNMTSLTSPMGRVEQSLYDVAGRLTERVTPGGNRIFYDYDTLNSLADKSYHNAGELENDHPVQMVYNPMGQRIAMEDITGESTYTYDSLGRLKTATNGSGKVMEYFYDEADNLAAIRYPDGGEVSYEYDKNDNITKLTDRDGRATTYDYDPLNRLTKVVRADGSESVYTYNARNQVLEAENTCVCGFLISDYKYTYDNAGLVTKEVAKECLFASDKDYGHEGGSKDNCAHTVDNPWMNQDPEWETTVRTFTYDDNGQMVGCQESKGQFHKVTYTYKYDEAGNRTFAKKAKTFPYSYLESWQNTYTYNDDNQMVKAQVCEGNLTKDYTFAYDANGNMTAECFRRQAEVTYQYDAENRLTAVYDQQKLLMASTYDGDGNRAFQLNYNPAAVCGYGIGWGDEIYMPEHSQNEDESLTAEGLLFSYVCSDTGRAYDLTEYVNDTNREYTEVLTAYTINGGATESYSYAGNQRLSRNNIWTEARDVVPNETSYYLYDGRGSVTANTWYNGMVTDVFQYDPYGQVTLGSTEHADFYGYNGESYNPNTGLEFLRARYYNADMGRFFQEDSYLGKTAEPLTLNRYAYGKNSPMNYADPSGHVPSTTPDSDVSPYKPNYPSNGSNVNACKAIAALIERHHGALIGGATGVAIVLLTVTSGGSALVVFGAGMVGGATGMMTGGMIHKGIDSAAIAYELKTKYGYNIAEHHDIEVSELPEEAQKLCERYDENVEDAETYLSAGTTAGVIGAALYEAGILLDSIGASVKSTSKNAYEKVKNWVNGIAEGETKTIIYGSDAKSEAKLNNQINTRGWTKGSIQDTVDNPYTTRISKNLSTQNPATTYYNKDGSYVILDDITNAVVQISNRNDPNWVPDANIQNPYKPGGNK